VEERPMQSEEEINLLDYAIVLAKRKKLIAYVTSGVVLTAIIAVLVMSPIYSAETRLLPPQQSGSSLAMGLMGQVGGGVADIGSALGLGGTTTSDLYVDIVKGRTIIDKIIDRFDLMKKNEYEYRDDARKQLVDKVLDVSSDKKSGVITIAIQDKDPKLAADMANAFVEELKILNKAMANSEASQRKLFFEEQMKDTKVALTKAEEDLKKFQEKTGALAIDEQAKAVLYAISELRAREAAKEVEIKVMKSFSTKQNPDLQRLETELASLSAERRKRESGGAGGHDPLMATSRMPEVGLGYLRAMRDVKYNENLYELLVKQYELAKFDEVNSAAVIQVIDKAVPHDRKVKPKRIVIVIFAAFVGLFLSVFIVFFQEFMSKSYTDPEKRAKLDEFKGHSGLTGLNLKFKLRFRSKGQDRP